MKIILVEPFSLVSFNGNGRKDLLGHDKHLNCKLVKAAQGRIRIC
jgi:hypothetical protein